MTPSVVTMGSHPLWGWAQSFGRLLDLSCSPSGRSVLAVKSVCARSACVVIGICGALAVNVVTGQARGEHRGTRSGTQGVMPTER
jgi:hypothetical protein